VTAAAPTFRSICMLTGDQAAPPSAFFRAMSEADQFCADLAEVNQLRAENAALRDSVDDLGCLLQRAYRRISELTSGAALPAVAASERPAADFSSRPVAGHHTTTS
jgi:hypothetical protein